MSSTASSLMLRRVCCLSTSTASFPVPSSNKKPLVFLGSPQVSTLVLDALFNASASPESPFQVAAIVTQPPSRKGRGNTATPTPVGQYALDRGFPAELIFTPERAGEEAFLSDLRTLQADLCITAAYGNILPRKFLKIPRSGTVNIHPSLLPLYRGAAPVQRALQDGVKETGVSVAYTVHALDAGPIIANKRFEVDNEIKAPDLLDLLFNEGSKLLLRELPSILDGSAKEKSWPQDDSKTTLAPKISLEEGWLSFEEEAIVLHNKVRAFAGWPGTRAKIRVDVKKDGNFEVLELKVITTRVCTRSDIGREEADDITYVKGAMIFPCGRGTYLEVLEVQVPGKRAMDATAVWNGWHRPKAKVL